MERVGGFQRGTFSFTYLGVPIFKGRKRTDMFMFLRDKISARIHTWSHKHLSFGGRLLLIKSTLGSIPLHVFQVLEPTKEALKQMEGLLARFFWGTTHEKKRLIGLAGSTSVTLQRKEVWASGSLGRWLKPSE